MAQSLNLETLKWERLDVDGELLNHFCIHDDTVLIANSASENGEMLQVLYEGSEPEEQNIESEDAEMQGQLADRRCRLWKSQLRIPGSGIEYAPQSLIEVCKSRDCRIAHILRHHRCPQNFRPNGLHPTLNSPTLKRNDTRLQKQSPTNVEENMLAVAKTTMEERYLEYLSVPILTS